MRMMPLTGRPPSNQPLTSICTCIMDAQEGREARLSRRRERERMNCALESAEEREARLARRRVRDRALRAAQSTAQREALQRRRERGFREEFTYVRTYVHVHMFVRPHMRGHEQHPQTRSGSPLLVRTTAVLSIYIYDYIYMVVRTSFHKCSTSRFMRMTLFCKCPMYPLMRNSDFF